MLKRVLRPLSLLQHPLRESQPEMIRGARDGMTDIRLRCSHKSELVIATDPRKARQKLEDTIE